MGLWLKIVALLNKLQSGKAWKSGNSYVITIPKKGYKSWLQATGYKIGWVDKEELEALLKTDILNDRKVLIVIPLFEDEKL